MATAEQIKSLIRSHLSMNAKQFYTSALQLAAHVAEGARRVVIDLKVDDRRDKEATIQTKKTSVKSTS